MRDDDSHQNRTGGNDATRTPSHGPDALAHEMRALLQVLEAMNHPPVPGEAWEGALALIMKATGATVGSIWRFDVNGLPFRAAGVGLTPQYLHAHQQLPDFNLVQQELLSLPDVALLNGNDLGFVPDDRAALHELIGVRSMALLPMRARQMRLGAVLLGHPETNGFKHHSMDFLRALAQVMTGALDRAPRPAGSRISDPLELVTQMLSHLDTGVALLGGADAQVLGHNPAFALLVAGDAAAALSGHRVSDLGLGGRGERLQLLVRSSLAADRAKAVVELEDMTPTRAPILWSAMVAPVTGNPSGVEPRVVIALTDITARRELENQARHAHKMEAVGTLAGGIAHEFNNLLTAILGNVSLSLLDLPFTHPLVPGLRDSETAALRAAELTRQLLGFGRRAPVILRVSDLAAVVQEALVRVEHLLDHRIRIERDLPSASVPVLADPLQVAQVIANLCLNARDAMPMGGVLTVRLRQVAVAHAMATRHGEFACLEVQDTGEGIEPEVMARIYEPFFSTKGPDRGTGLGLALVHTIVEQHGGWIECESAPGHGTTFRVYLLRRMEAVVPHPNPASPDGTVLVVEDESALRGFARSVLERLGYHVVLARDGIEALDLVQRGMRVDVVLLDLTMPRLSGPDTLRRLREIAPGLPVVLTSGYESGAGPPGPDGLEVEAFLAKPYSPEHLGAAVREALDLKR
ncbi:MAG: ATP-binding protein [Candidatus Eisenbacteria bacterium]